LAEINLFSVGSFLPDGRRQILNFLLPGDLVGLQAAMLDAALHGIEALTEVQLCVLSAPMPWVW
jgi:CRP-like cAMP-binding protein